MSTSSVLAVFRVVAPEFSATADSDVEDVIEIVTLDVDTTQFGSLASTALARLTAHELTLQARTSASAAGATGVGAVTSLRAGDVAVTYGGQTWASDGAEDDYLRQTKHGLAYLRIRDSRAGIGFGVLT